jgi:hypothetical protein
MYSIACDAIEEKLMWLAEWEDQEREHYTDAEWDKMVGDYQDALDWFEEKLRR